MTDQNQSSRTWGRECVICTCEWLEADEGPNCPECEDRKYASGEGRLVWKDGRYGRSN